jgi:hypothetical protein
MFFIPMLAVNLYNVQIVYPIYQYMLNLGYGDGLYN